MELFSQCIRRLCIVSMYVTYVAITEGNCKTIEEMVGSNENLEKCMDYLHKYSYVDEQMDSDMVKSMDPSEVEAMVRQMQRYMPNIQVTGVLDNATMAMMDQPRCGVPDPNGESGGGELRIRVRRYSHLGGRWQQHTITYRILNTAREMSLADVRDAVRRAFDVWEEEIPMTFTEIFSGTADIEMSFREGDHSEDRFPFDGIGYVLAHAFPPPEGSVRAIDGDVHFDDAELFTTGTTLGTNLFFVAVHEIGHSLGLNHSMDPTAVMAPFYRGYEPNLRLSNDDVLGIRALYVPEPCNPNPCLNEGQCYNLGATNDPPYICICAEGFNGPKCETEVIDDPCASFSCNNGVCESDTSTPQCICSEGFTGTFCDTIISICDPSSCGPNGICFDWLAAPLCIWLFGYTETCCDVLVTADPCDPSPCLNGAVCFRLDAEDFFCLCANGFSGTLCGEEGK